MFQAMEVNKRFAILAHFVAALAAAIKARRISPHLKCVCLGTAQVINTQPLQTISGQLLLG